MTSLARTERSELCDVLTEVGPDAPTLCEGWRAADLAAHLVIRERRPDAVAGELIKPLAPRQDRIQRGYAGLPWARLVDLVRTGPPRWSPLAIPAVDGAVNTVEYFVHHEDVRRAQPGWEPRELSAQQQETLWRRLRSMSRLLLRRAAVGVALRRPDGAIWRARGGGSYVTLAGPPAELVLYAFGRG
ncbi:MAG: TIGR03085 family protein, partial [Acidothermales bacterium]|nr:TIGR03085 family protein [Acidothermales bacterium]